MIAEFKEFIEKFSVVPVAVAFVIAGAIIPVIDAFTAVLMSIIGKVGGLDTNFNAWQPGDIPVGRLITAIIAFLILAFAIFMLIKALKKAGMGTDGPPPDDVVLLGEIKDLLAQR